ncbi:hypothetical protein F1188_20170 [Roseospira marina]|uniref:Uncharacterized protein n=1 Tax=Roseospira marina TaxID=140057 RepID=A0A5M6I492_9PROT|nr:hypothetical protein [Roseospira marina]KAA5603003.1 hypothetical protein F1188_20170 [Roseospira marina]MBB4313034.1 transcriptional regulator with XRE-family HTH domain [Roseospira marina]MBB5089297.1 transcriptional regulator with XRE-family HTH domain [Roseospira marina]
MTCTATFGPLPGDDVAAAVAEVRSRIHAVCRRYDAKSLARLCGVSVKTAESWREGRATPQPDGMARLAAALGRQVLDVIYGPVIGEQTLDQGLAGLGICLDVYRQGLKEKGLSDVVLGYGAPADFCPGAGAEEGGMASEAGGASRRARRVVASAVLMLAVSLGAALLPLLSLGADDDPLLRARNPRPTSVVVRVVAREC